MSPWNNPPKVVAAPTVADTSPRELLVFHALDIDRVRDYIDRLSFMLRDEALAKPDLAPYIAQAGSDKVNQVYAAIATGFKSGFRVDPDVPMGYLRIMVEGQLQFRETALTEYYKGLENKALMHKDLASFKVVIVEAILSKDMG